MGRETEEESPNLAPNALFDLPLWLTGEERSEDLSTSLDKDCPGGRTPSPVHRSVSRGSGAEGSAQGPYRVAGRTGPTGTPPPSAVAAPAGC